jgi:general secretion pathway protein A
MYEAHFNLTGKPFQLNPDPRFFYRSQGHKRALAYMRYGLQQEQGFIVVTGDVGTGKTMLVNNLFREIEGQGVVAAKIVSSNVKDLDLLRLIAAEFDIPFERASKANLLRELEARFTACRDEGKRVLLVVDEAQNLPRSALEELRMLSNFDHNGVPLVQSFLLGQREFRGILRAPGLEQLRQRVIAAYHLKPLSAAEIKAYIEYRMRKVGWTDNPVIEEPVFQRIYEFTGGVPRRINTLFDRTLLNCYLDDAHIIGPAMLDAVCLEILAEQGEAGDEIDERPEGWEPVRVAPAAVGEDAASKKGELAEMETRLVSMQHVIEDLTSKLVAAQHPPAAPSMPLAVTVADESPRFPWWTTTFLSALIVLAIIALSLGYWLLTRH